MGRKPRLLLLDAGAIFAALRHGAWEALIEAYDIVVPSTIVRVEAIFYTTLDGERIEIDLPAEVDAGRITEVEMAARADIRFVSADGPAIEAVAMLDADSRVISLAEALDLCGYTKRLPERFSRDFVNRHAQEGAIRKIQGRGLTSDQE